MPTKNIHILYFGTTKLVALRGSVGSGGEIHVEAFCRCPAYGFSQGAVSDLDKANHQLRVLLRNFLPPDETSRTRFQVILATPSLRGYFFNSSIYFGDYAKIITQADIQRAIAQTRTVATIPLDEMIIQSLPQEFIVNDMVGIKDPLEMEGRRLGVTLLLFSVKLSVIKNLTKILEKNDIEAERFIPKALASSFAVLRDDEKRDGVCLVDMGGFTTDLVYYKNDDVLCARTLEVGGETVTSGLVEALSVSSKEARRLKERFGSCRPESVEEELIPVRDAFGAVRMNLGRKKLCEAIRSQTKPLLERITPVLEEIRSDYKQISSVVLTGGGALLDGIVEMAQEEWRSPVRLGLVQKIHGPQEVVLASAQYSSCLGLLSEEGRRVEEQQRVYSTRDFFSKTFSRAREWVEEYL